MLRKTLKRDLLVFRRKHSMSGITSDMGTQYLYPVSPVFSDS